MLAVAVCAVMASAAAPSSTLRLASPGLTLFGIDPTLGTVFVEHLAQQLKFAGAEVFTEREISQLLGMERQKELMGCTDEASSCIGELANALGADAVVMGDAARVGERLQLNLKVIASRDGKTVAVYSDNVGSEAAALESLTRAARELASQSAANLGRALTPKFRESVDLRKVAIAPLAAGAVLLGVGTGLMVAANGNYQYVVSGMAKSDVDGRRAISAGSLQQNVGIAGLAVGAVAGAVGVALLIFGQPTGAAVVPTAGGVSVTWSGTLP